MLPDPTERNIDPLLFQTGIRVKKLVLTLAIHDKNVTMAEVARANITVQTGLALPSEERLGPNTHRHDEFGSTLQTEVRHHSANQHTSSIPGKGSGSRR